jgi:sialate O-acetylesterase
MVLRAAPHSSVVFGFDSPGATVTLALDGDAQKVSNVSDSTGLWRVFLAPVPYGGPHTLAISSSSGGTAVLNDVLFGSVFVCGGQSNVRTM